MRREPYAPIMKRLMSWHRDERGVVSIFLIFVVMIIFTMMSTFMDYARIAAMEWRTEAIGHAAARSILSAYDPVIQQRYGLFAYGMTDPAVIAEGVLNDHDPLGDKGFSWINLTVDQHTSVVERPIAGLAEFDHQVMEEMKYKAPIQIAFELIGKMKPVSGVMKEAAQTTELLHSISKLFDNRNKVLDEALRQQKQARDAAVGLHMTKQIGSLERLGESMPVGKIDAAVDIVRQYEDYRQMIQEDAGLEEKDRKYTHVTDQYERHVRQFSSSLLSSVQRGTQRHKNELEQALQAVADAKQLNIEMRNQIEKQRTTFAGSGYDQVTAATAPSESSKASDLDVIKQVHASADALPLPDSFFDLYEDEIREQLQQMLSLQQTTEHLQGAVSSAIGGAGSGGTLRNAVSELSRAWERYEDNYAAPSGIVLIERQREIDKLKEGDDSRRQHQQAAEQQLKQSRNLLTAIADLSVLEEHQNLFDEVAVKAEAVRAFNEASLSKGVNGMSTNGNPEEETARAMSSMTDLYSQLGQLATSSRDRLYRNEYAAMYFSSFHPSHMKSIVESGKPSQELIQALAIENQELEYIMYGFQSPVSNLAAAYGEIFAFRLAVRTMEGLVEHAKLMHPLAILAAAILHGVTMAITDMIQLVNTNAVPLSKFTPAITLSYHDFLRLFMMMHGDREEMSIRMLALIHHNTGIDPLLRGTYARIDVSTRMKLWFLPGITSVLEHAGLLEGQVKDGYYLVERRAAYAY